VRADISTFLQGQTEHGLTAAEQISQEGIATVDKARMNDETLYTCP
jgi:hypothetical protein